MAVCGQDACRGALLAKLITPQSDDFYILKSKQSAFHSTPLAVLLDHCGVRRVVITGINRGPMRRGHRDQRAHARPYGPCAH